MSVTVETSLGRLRGVEENGLHVFRGVPFARARRFAPPVRPEPWAGVRSAAEPGPTAHQNASVLGPLIGVDLRNASEDCLSLNVWTPGPGRRPVMVWIHGGAFVMGAGSQPIYDGARLARHGDVVVVTINYRLGVLGFLRLDDCAPGTLPAAGNQGLLDQVVALEWVRDEIAAFGGDPREVTVFGESAGAMSVATLLGVPRARGLFRRAILESGAANFTASRETAAEVAHAFLHELGLAPHEAARLGEAPVTRLLEAQERTFLERTRAGRLGLPFVPVIDGEVLPAHPLAAVGDGLARDVALLAGTNLDENKLFAVTDGKARTLDEPTLLRRLGRNVPGPVGERAARAEQAVAVYRAARTARGERTTPPELWSAIETDRIFRYPAMRLAERQRTHQPAVHTYLFTWASPLLDGVLGACHALELPFVFGTLADPRIATFTGRGPDAQALSARMQDAWLAFARTGDPGWPAYDAGRRATMLLGRECGIEDAPREPERRFWEFWDGT
ncbi:MAG TPA: carboxylesterase/lipase family protein [Candidatus Binatia bacterium]|nr:carboxylesterase/lipase family protein [Candidatus Binatia bacterium]